jgi:hypothetical protein
MYEKKAASGCFFSGAREGRSVRGELTRGDGSLGTDGTEFLAEFLNAASGVDDFVLTGEEWVRFSRHLDLDQRVFFALVFNFFAGLDGRTGDEFEVAGQIVEHDFAVVWVNFWFHVLLSIGR